MGGSALIHREGRGSPGPWLLLTARHTGKELVADWVQPGWEKPQPKPEGLFSGTASRCGCRKACVWLSYSQWGPCSGLAVTGHIQKIACDRHLKSSSTCPFSRGKGTGLEECSPASDMLTPFYVRTNVKFVITDIRETRIGSCMWFVLEEKKTVTELTPMGTSHRPRKGATDTVWPLPLKQCQWLHGLHFPPPQLAAARTHGRSQEGQPENSTLCSQAGLVAPSAWDEHTASDRGLCGPSSSLCPRHLAPRPSDPTGLPRGSWSQVGSSLPVTCRIYGWNLVATN